jgi:hypothetical protein
VHRGRGWQLPAGELLGDRSQDGVDCTELAEQELVVPGQQTVQGLAQPAGLLQRFTGCGQRRCWRSLKVLSSVC